MSTSTQAGNHRNTTGTAEQPRQRNSVHPAGFGIRGFGIGVILVGCGGLIVGWASRHQRMSGSPSTAEPISRQVEGGI